MRDEKLHAVVAQSTFPSQNVQSTPCSDHFWKLTCRKSARCVARSTFRSQKKLRVRSTFGRSDVVLRCFAWQVQGIVHLVKSEQKREGFVACPKTIASVGHLKGICKDAFSVPGAVQETCSSELFGGQGQGADFLRGVAFWRIRSSVNFEN